MAELKCTVNLDASNFPQVITQSIVRFAAWLTCQPEEIKLGSMHNSVLAIDLCRQFCAEYGIPQTEIDWDGELADFFYIKNHPIQNRETLERLTDSLLNGGLRRPDVAPPDIGDMHPQWCLNNGVQSQSDLEALWVSDPGIFGLDQQ